MAFFLPLETPEEKQLKPKPDPKPGLGERIKQAGQTIVQETQKNVIQPAAEFLEEDIERGGPVGTTAQFFGVGFEGFDLATEFLTRGIKKVDPLRLDPKFREYSEARGGEQDVFVPREELIQSFQERPFLEQLFLGAVLDPGIAGGGVAAARSFKNAPDALIAKQADTVGFNMAKRQSAFLTTEGRKPSFFEKIDMLKEEWRPNVLGRTQVAHAAPDLDGLGDNLEQLAKLGADNPERLEELRRRWRRYQSLVDEQDTPAQRAGMEELAKKAEIEYGEAVESALKRGQMMRRGPTRLDEVEATVNNAIENPEVVRSQDYDTQLSLFDDMREAGSPVGNLPEVVGEMTAKGDGIVEAVVDGSKSRAYTFDPEINTLFDLNTPVRIELTAGEKLTNLVKDVTSKLDFPTPADIDPRPAAIFRWHQDAILKAESQASRMEGKFQALISENFKNLDSQGRLPNLAGIDPSIPGAPTIQDVAARLPNYEAHLTRQQLDALKAMDDSISPFRNTLVQVGIDLGERPDIIPGGFYLPRGRTLLDDLDDVGQARKIRTKGRKIGQERAAQFESMAQGIDQGYEYGRFTDTIRDASFSMGRRAIDEHVVKFFKSLRDETGDLLMETPKQRLLRQNPGISKVHDTLREKLTRLKQLDRSISSRTSIRIQEFLDDPAYENIPELRRELARAFSVSRGKYKGATLLELREVQKDINIQLKKLANDWNKAKAKAAIPDRTEGVIQFSGLEQYGFPKAMADSANDIIRRISRQRSVPERVVRAVLNIFRGMQSTLDASGMFIQGLLGMHNDLPAFLRAVGIQFRSWGDANVLGRHMNDFDLKAMQQGLPTTEHWADVGLRFSGGEGELVIGSREGFEALGKLPLIKQTNRAFSNFGDSLRMDWAQDLYRQASKGGKSPVTRDQMQSIAEFVNNATGWSKGKAGGEVGDFLLFAPRFMQSRLETMGNALLGLRPGASMKQRYAAKSMVRFMVQGAIATFAINEMLGNETDWNPMVKVNGEWRRNSNFMRIRVPGIERDVSLFGTWDSLLGLMLTVGSAGVNEDKWAAFQALRLSGSGIVSNSWDFISGRDFEGNRTRDTGKQIIRRLLKNVEPFVAEQLPQSGSDLWNAVHNKDANLAVKGIGGGIVEFLAIKGTPLTFQDVQQDIVRDLVERGELPSDDPDVISTPAAQRKIKSHPDYIKAQEARKERQLSAQPLNPRDAVDVWLVLKEEYDQNIIDAVNAGAEGQALRLNIQETLRQRSNDARALFDILAPAKDEPTMDTFRALYESYWSADAPIDPATGRPDFETRDAKRLLVLERAKELGFKEADIRDRFEFSDNPTVNDAVKLYHMSMEELRPYWDLTEQVVETWPPEAQEIWNRYEVADDNMKPVFESEYPFLKELTLQRQAYRADHPKVDYLLTWWGYSGLPATDPAIDLYIQRAEKSLTPTQ